MFIVYLLLLTILVLSSRDKFSFYSTKHMEDHLIYKTNEGSTFETLMTTQDVKDWLQSSIINIIHNQTYDSHQKEGNGWLSDGYSRMLGVPRIRQMRVKDGFCRTPSEMKILVEKCIAEYTQDTKDVLDYSVGWKQKVRKDVKVDSEYWRVIEPWKYQSTWQLKLVAQFGVLHFYGNEGYYAAQLGRTGMNTSS